MSFGPASTGSGDRASGERTSVDARTTGTALVRFVPSAPTRARPAKGTMIWAAGLALALGAGGLGLDVVRSAKVAGTKAVQQADVSDKVQRLQDEISRLKGSIDTMRADGAKPDEPLRGLKKSVDGLRQEIEQIKTNNGATLAQLASKLDKSDRDPSQKLADIMARLDKLDRDPKNKGTDGANQKLADVASRLDRMERQVSSQTPTGSLPTPAPVKVAVLAPSGPVPVKAAIVTSLAPAPTAAALAPPTPMPPSKPVARVEVSAVAAADPKPVPAKPATVDGWVLRDVYDGMALVEARRGGLREIAPGEYLPGAGEVRSIERRGRSWVVLTSRGIIENGTW